MTIRFIDCNGLAGATSLGFIQAGFTLAGRVGELSLGMENMRANRRITGWDWEDEFSANPMDWHIPADSEVVAGNPPCSAWSTLTSKAHRGTDASILKHTDDVITYAGRFGPTMVAFESVQQAYTGAAGRKYLISLRDRLEELTGHKYDLHHVLHNNATVGGAAQRKRYWWVASRVQFGVDPPIPFRVPDLIESIGDLRGLSDTWELQPYVYPDTWWSSRRRSDDGMVDGHHTRKLTHAKRINELLHWLDGDWPQGDREEDAARRVYAKYGTLPPSWKTQEERLLKRNFDMGFNQLVRWRADRPARVLTGAALSQALHPTENRLFTFRETMRIQGWPDNWRLGYARNVAGHGKFAGKGVPVDSSRWLGVWAKASLEGNPGSMKGVPVGDREFLHDSTHNWKMAPPELGRRVLNV